MGNGNRKVPPVPGDDSIISWATHQDRNWSELNTWAFTSNLVVNAPVFNSDQFLIDFLVGGPLDYTVISWVWGNLSISISHPQSQSQLLVNIDITWNKCNILNRSTRLIWNRMKEFEDVAQGDWGQGGVVTEYLRTPGVGHVTDCAAWNTTEAPGTWVLPSPWHWVDWPGRPENNAGSWQVSLWTASPGSEAAWRDQIILHRAAHCKH